MCDRQPQAGFLNSTHKQRPSENRFSRFQTAFLCLTQPLSLMQPVHIIHFFAATQNHGDALMQAFRADA